MHHNLLNRLSDQLGNNPALGKELISLFADQTEKDLQAIEAALASENLANISKICHKMKSSLLALGLEEEANSMRDLEQACNTQTNIAAVLPLISDCTTKLRVILNAIRSN